MIFYWGNASKKPVCCRRPECQQTGTIVPFCHPQSCRYDEAGVEMQFKSAAAISVTYTLLERCGFEPAGWFDRDDFQAIHEFSTPDSVYALGTAVSDMSREVLRNIERTVKTTIRRRNAERSQYEYEQQERDLLDRRGLPAPEPDPEPAPEAAGQVRQAAPDVPERPSPGAVQHDAPEREPVPAPVGSGAERSSDEGAADDRTADEEPGPGQGEPADGVGTAHEQPESAGRGTGADGADLQLSFFDAHIPTEAQQIEAIDQAESEKTPSAFVLSQAEIENELRKHGSGFEGGNVDALTKAQPKDLEASEIDVRLGATWLAPSIVQQFMMETFQPPYRIRYNNAITVRYSPYTSEWRISNKSATGFGDIMATETYGTRRANAYKILEDTLNLRDSRVYDTIEEDGKEKRVLNQNETTLAQQKQQAIKDAFAGWVWKDPQRRALLVKKYNELFNSTRPREYDGSHIHFVGMNPEINLREHQRNAVAHVLYGYNTLLAHEVGAGKSFEMAASAMELKRLGLCQKSLFVVPNHLTEQWASEFLRLYPNAKLLVTSKKDFEPANRKKFCARIATGDYDAVIIGHSQFEKIPLSAERQERLIQEQMDEIEEAIEEAKSQAGEHFTVKQLEKLRKSLKQKLEKLQGTDRKDDVVTMKNSIHDNANGLDYTLVNDHYLPNLTVAAPTEQHPTGRWGRLHKMYLKEQHPVRYNQLLLSGELGGYLAKLDKQAEEQFALTIRQMQEAEGVTEALKAANQLEWVRRMNSIRNRAEEIIKTELIFV